MDHNVYPVNSDPKRTNRSDLKTIVKAVDLLISLHGNPTRGKIVLDEKSWKVRGEKHSDIVTLSFNRKEDIFEITRQNANGTFGIRYSGIEFLMGLLTIIFPEGEKLIDLDKINGNTTEGTLTNMLLSDLEWMVWGKLTDEVGLENLFEFKKLELEWERGAHEFFEAMRALLRDRFGRKKELD